MTIPQIPDKIHKTTLKNTIIDLLASIALEETALSNILNSEAEKIQAFVGEKRNFPSGASTKEIIQFNQTVNKMLDSLLMTEWLLLKKLDTVMEFDLQGKKQEKRRDDEEEDDKDSIWDDSAIERESFWDENGSSDEIPIEDGDEEDIYW